MLLLLEEAEALSLYVRSPAPRGAFDLPAQSSAQTPTGRSQFYEGRRTTRQIPRGAESSRGEVRRGRRRRRRATTPGDQEVPTVAGERRSGRQRHRGGMRRRSSEAGSSGANEPSPPTQQSSAAGSFAADQPVAQQSSQSFPYAWEERAPLVRRLFPSAPEPLFEIDSIMDTGEHTGNDQVVPEAARLMDRYTPVNRPNALRFRLPRRRRVDMVLHSVPEPTLSYDEGSSSSGLS